MRKTIFSLVLLFFIIPALAEGADWVLIAEGKKGTTLFVDKENIIHISKDVVRAWVNYVKSEPVKFESKYIKEVLKYEEWHCTEKKHKTLIAIHYYTDKTCAIAEGQDEGWSYVSPNSLGSAVFEYLCKNGK